MPQASPPQVLYAGRPVRLKRRHLVNAIRFGPVHCAWWPYHRGEAAEPQVRAWLAQALGETAKHLPLNRDHYGRPRLDGHLAGRDVNWSHSGERLIAAWGEGVELGIDIEHLLPRPKALALAQRFFTAEETAWLTTLAEDPAQLHHQFTRLWCAKEAVLKAHGRGLSFGLHRLRFALDDAFDDVFNDMFDDAFNNAMAAPQLVTCDSALGDARDWQLRAWSPSPGYLATLAWRTR